MLLCRCEMLFYRGLVTLSFLALLQISSWGVARADVSLEVGDNVRVERATATAAQEGESSRLQFRIVNDSSSRIHVTGIETSVAPTARLVARIGPGEYSTLESLGIPPGETFDLTTSHLWYETGPLVRSLSEGEVFEMTLGFVAGSLSVPVHVHFAPQAP